MTLISLRVLIVEDAEDDVWHDRRSLAGTHLDPAVASVFLDLLVTPEGFSQVHDRALA